MDGYTVNILHLAVYYINNFMWKAIPAKSGISQIALHICIKIGTCTFKYMLPQINQYTNLLKINFYQIYAKYHTGMFIVTIYYTYNILRVQYFAEIFCNR